MLGQLLLTVRGRGRPEREELYGLTVLRAEIDAEGFFGARRLKRTAGDLRRRGALRVLTAAGFDRWPQLLEQGLLPVEAAPFIRAQSVPLALESLKRQGCVPERTTVALRGLRADREMARTARELAGQVRHLVVDAPRGGTELARWLRRELGVPIVPPGERGELALHFAAVEGGAGEHALRLYGSEPDLAGLTLTAPALEPEDRGHLPMLAALWEGGKLGRKDIKIT